MRVNECWRNGGRRTDIEKRVLFFTVEVKIEKQRGIMKTMEFLVKVSKKQRHQ